MLQDDNNINKKKGKSFKSNSAQQYRFNKDQTQWRDYCDDSPVLNEQC